MAKIRSVDFLPEIFQTPTNKKFLNSTLDQLVQEPKLKQTQGYIGRLNAPGKASTDGYVLEPSEERTNYQLEPGIIFKDEDGATSDALTYVGILDGLQTKGANTDNHDRLFRSETYSWSPLIDFDKFVNYSQYFWMPGGPASVNVSAIDVSLTDDFDVTAETSHFTINGFGSANPTLTLLRGGTYTFEVDQVGSPFYIQTQPGVDGVLPWSENISSRDIWDGVNEEAGPTNNGTASGTITFEVPLATDQQFYHDLTSVADVDLATTLDIADLQDELVDSVNDINGIQDYENKTIVFLTDPLAAGNVYQIQFSGLNISVVLVSVVANEEKFNILYGATYSNRSFWNNAGTYEEVPLFTASLDTLYYQDASNPSRYGIINVINQEDAATIDATSIIGRETYTSPNGVVFTNGLKVRFRGEVLPPEFIDKEFYVEGVGEAIRLVPVEELVVPEPYSISSSGPWDVEGWDLLGWDGTLNAPAELDYITINRASRDRNAWSRSNRWFHIDVITATAEYNGTVVNVDNDNRASRPIIEFKPDLRLFDYGTDSKSSISTIDFETEDAMSTVNGAASFSIDGHELATGSRVIFANDTDPSVKNRIYEVELIDPEDDGSTVINLTPAVDADVLEDDMVLLTTGITLKGNVYRFDGTTWVEAQAKESVNQAPLFDVYDRAGNSFSDFEAYPSTNFEGSKLFSYAEGTGTNDPVLGFPLAYLNINNLGDIVFDNNFYSDTFFYVEGDVSQDAYAVSNGVVRKPSSRTEYTEEIGWVTSAEPSYQSQVFDFVYDGNAIELDITPRTDLTIPAVQVYAGAAFVTPENYTVTGSTVTFVTTMDTGTELQIKVISEDISDVGYYEIPTNLASNMFNENIEQLTLGTIRNHFNALAQNVIEIEGNINGANNIRDLGNVDKFGTLIVQQSSPLALTAMFMRSKEYNFFSAVDFGSRQYEKYKNQILSWIENNDIFDMTPGQVLDAAIKAINVGKTTASPFYWSDMLPAGEDYETTTYEITAISTDTFTTLNTYDFENANTQAMLVYYNGALLTKDTDYTVATDGPRITLLITTTVGEILQIDEYNSTLGALVPSTPTKLGLYPRFKPMIFEDDTFVTPTDVIRGHDGSITAAFGDTRDDVMLEFEKRIYNNIKVNEDIPIEPSDIIPGVFRETDYTDDEINSILAPSVLSWLGWNRIDFRRQDYDQSEPKTWNYSTASCKIKNAQVTKGHWRGIYKCYYDTTSPHLRPWEMLGFTEQPDWWVTYYGAAPYTSGNLVLWDDLEAGLVRDPAGEYTIEKYKRPGLTTILPVDGEGNLVMPLDSVIADYTPYDFKKSWQLGDGSPAETAWARSSAYPFAMQRLYALTKPAQFFALMADRDRYVNDSDIGQYLYDSRYRIDARSLDLRDVDNVKNSYINWIIDYNLHFGYNSLEQLRIDLANMDVNLCYRMAAFTDKNNLKIFTDKSSPDSTNSSLLLPDESFQLLFYKNQPSDEIIYSSVIVQKVSDGYSLLGNSTTDPYFKVQTSVRTGKFDTVSVGRTENSTTSVNVPIDFTDEVEYVPYGQVFTSKQAVASFISGYSEYLRRAGLMFTVQEGAQEVNWTQMIQEFIYWADQGWAEDSVINLNPSATQLEFERELHVVDDLNNMEITEQPLNQNREPLDLSNYSIDRIDNNFKMRMLNDTIVSYLKFNLTNFEHLLVLDNVSIFNDLIYDPVTGVRQQRVKLAGFTTFDWNGQLNAPGFLYNEDNVEDWSEIKSYNFGDIVKYKNAYWSASKKLQPTDTFDFGSWTKTDYGKISTGLLPNIATKADQMLDFYNNKTANLESDVDLLAFGLTGYRTRDYLQSLDLDDISQVNIYSDMIGNKGTGKSLDLFKNVNLNNEAVDYTISENWALRRAYYGATGNRSYIELQLDGDQLTANPGLVEIVDALTDESVADQLIPVSEIYKQSEKNIDKEILPVRIDTNTDTQLPTAGAVNANDVDYAVFEFADLDDLADVTEGDTVWVAKDTATDWNVYRTFRQAASIVEVADNLDGTLTVSTDIGHGLVADTPIVISDVDDLVDGTHTVLSVTDALNFVIVGQLGDDQTCVLDIDGIILKFETSRFDTPADIAGSIYDNNLYTYDKAWIKDFGGKSATFNKTAPFAVASSIASPGASTTDDYALSVAQGYDDAGMLVGAPGSNVAWFYDKSSQFGYTLNRSVDLVSNPNVERYGHKVALKTSWGAITAPGDTFPGQAVIVNRNKLEGFIVETQFLRNLNPADIDADGFGAAFAMSKDEIWAVVGEPAEDRIHVYQRIDYQNQVFSTLADGATTVYDISADVIAANADEINVIVNNVALEAGVYYTFDGTEVTLIVTPAADETVVVSRKDFVLHDGDGIVDTFSVSELYALDGIDSLVVTVDGIMQRPVSDYTLVGTDIVFDAGSIPPGTSLGNINISLATTYRYVDTIVGTAHGATLGDRFGAEIDISENGSHIVVGAPDSSTGGDSYIFNRVVERFIVEDDAIVIYTTLRTPLGSVYRNGTRLVDGTDTFNLSPQYSVTGALEITLEADVANVGDFIDVDTAEFKLMQVVTAATPEVGATFSNAISICKSKCAIYFGAENENSGQGSVTRYINASRIEGAITSTVTDPGGTGTIRINNFEVDITGTTTALEIADIINAEIIPNVTASASDGILTIELVNKTIRSIANKLDVLPGSQTLASLGLIPYTIDQTITSPVTTTQPQYFGSSLYINLDMDQLVVGARGGDAIYNNDYVVDTTTISADTDAVTADAQQRETNTGVVYTYDLLPGEGEFTTGKLVLGQTIVDTSMTDGDNFGYAVSLVDDALVVASPNYDSDIGRIAIFGNTPSTQAWVPTNIQNDIVDVELINAINVYDDETLQLRRDLDYIDPLHGKILGAAQQNLDYITVFDPATYDETYTGKLWGAKHVGELWWDVSNVRFLDYNLGDPKYASKIWGSVFSGSSIDVYEWVVSSVVPSEYAGTGTVYDIDKYITITGVDRTGTLQNTYGYWVNQVETISTNSEKTLSAAAIASYIESPKSSGISYAALINPSLLGLYNCTDIITEDTSILHVEYDKAKNDDNVFVEYDLFREDNETDFLSDSLYKKLQDSLCGVDTLGNLVPDPALSETDKYGIEFRPRKSLFVDRSAALTSYMTNVNDILARYTIAEGRTYPLLNSEEATPPASSGEWDLSVADEVELSYQDLTLVPTGYKYLVETDNTRDGLWTIYEVDELDELSLVDQQSYDTKRFWSTVTWYADGFDPFTKVDYVVNEVSDLTALGDVENNAVARVLSNSVGSQELHQYTDGVWTRVSLDDGTIQIDSRIWDFEAGRYGWDVEVWDVQNNDEEPVAEMRQIIRSINEELLVGDLALERNATILGIFNYILSEQPNVDWLMKTSLIDVTQKARSLTQYAVYQKDNQDYLNQYISETKPYHTKIKDFSANYEGIDIFEGSVTDFDCPAEFEEAFNQYVSPILDDGATLVTDVSNRQADDEIWERSPYDQWFQNYRLTLVDVVITDGGLGYLTPPDVIITGDATTPATLEATLGPGGSVTSITIVDPGSGYTETPTITLTPLIAGDEFGTELFGFSVFTGPFEDAVAVPILDNVLVRSIKTTIKYDRYEYQTNVVDWEADTAYTAGQLVKVNNTVYEIVDEDPAPTFNPSLHTLVPIEDLSGIDRTYGYYQADINSAGLDLSLLINGISFPGVQIDGISFNQETGFDIANFDVVTFDNIDFGPEGLPTYSEDLIDAIYESGFPGQITADTITIGEDYKITVVGSTDFTLIGATDNNVGTVFTATGVGTADAIVAIYSLDNWSDSLNTYSGTRPTDIDVGGGEFIDTYHSHAPEELVPGSIFDTLDIRVVSRPGSDYDEDGHAFDLGSTLYEVTSALPQSYSFDGIMDHPIKVLAVNATTGVMLYETVNFIIDWPNLEIDITSGASIGDIVKIFVYEIGGGNQLNRTALYGDEVSGTTFNIPVADTEIYESIVFVNGVLTPVTITSVNAYTSSVDLGATPAASDFITATIFGFDTPQYEESYPVTQLFTAPATADITPEDVGKYRHNAIVEVEGLRLRPPEGAKYIADGIEDEYYFPAHGDYLYNSVVDSEVDVYLNNVLLTLGVDYTVSPPILSGATFGTSQFGSSSFTSVVTDTPRFITLTTVPDADDSVEVYVRTNADYWWSGSEVVFGTTPTPGDLIAVTTFKDDSELDIFTQVFIGPTLISEVQESPFDVDGFDDATFDEEIGVDVEVNQFVIDRPIVTNGNRLWVTLNGERLQNGSEYQIINDNVLELSGALLLATDVLVVTSMTENVVTDGAEFRLFKDMRDNYGMYKVKGSTTYLTAELLPADDIIYVNDASVLGEPNLPIGQFGILIVNGERITYRDRDTVLNTVSGLRRGTAGTAIAEQHAIADAVYDVSKKSFVPMMTPAGNLGAWDIETTYIIGDIVKHNGIYWHAYDTPILGEFNETEWSRYDEIWYEPGTQLGDADAIPLQNQETAQATFIKN